MKTVAGKIAIITGAGSGINYAFASLLVSQGCSVVIADLALTPAAEALVDNEQRAEEGGPGRAVYKRTDVTSWADLAALFPFAREQLGGDVDIVVPGAGIFEPEWSSFFWGEAGDTAAEARYKTLDVNLVHPIKLTRLALSHFLESGVGPDGKVVLHVSSISGQTPKLSTPIYTAAKHGINGFVRSLARLEREVGVKVCGVCPGVVLTPLWTDHPEKMQMRKQEDAWASAAEVADGMLRCVLGDEVRGGMLMEIGHDHTRFVEMFNDPGPPRHDGGKGCRLTGGHLLDDQAVEMLKREGEELRKRRLEELAAAEKR